jgi:3-methyladenine DNA glycosylase AlkC
MFSKVTGLASEYLRCFYLRWSIRMLLRLQYPRSIHPLFLLFVSYFRRGRVRHLSLLCSFVRLPPSIRLYVLLSLPTSTVRVRSHYMRTAFLRHDIRKDLASLLSAKGDDSKTHRVIQPSLRDICGGIGWMCRRNAGS